MRAGDYRRASEDITAFLNAYGDFVSCLRRVDGGYHGAFWQVRPDQEARLQTVMPRVATAGGRAARAFQTAGVMVSYKPPGTMQYTDVNPALVWSTLLDEYPMITPDVLVTVGSQAIGVLESLRDEAAERERGLAGLFARFVRFPVRVREAAGLPPRTVSGGLLSGLVALVQAVLIAAVGGVLVFPLAQWLGWSPNQ